MENIPLPVFQQAECDKLPLKWLKHLLLVRVGLRDLRELNAEIFRFNMSKKGIAEAKMHCLEVLRKEQQKSNTVMIVLKMVFSEKTMQLPNYRVSLPSQVPSVFRQIRYNYLNTADELWLCRSSVNSSGCNLGGRVSIRIDSAVAPEILEIIWYTSPRVIDEYQIMNLPYPYARAYRYPGSLSFVLDTLHTPEKYSSNPDQKNELFKNYRFVLSSLLERKEQIATLADMLCRSGAREIILQFKVDSGNFKMIDWDTDVESDIFLGGR